MEFFNFLMFDAVGAGRAGWPHRPLIGLIAQKKPVTECIKGTVKTIMGFCHPGAGATLVVNSAGRLRHHLSSTPSASRVVPNNEAIVPSPSSRSAKRWR